MIEMEKQLAMIGDLDKALDKAIDALIDVKRIAENLGLDVKDIRIMAFKLGLKQYESSKALAAAGKKPSMVGF